MVSGGPSTRESVLNQREREDAVIADLSALVSSLLAGPSPPPSPSVVQRHDPYGN
eukprot:gene41316-42452_t